MNFRLRKTRFFTLPAAEDIYPMRFLFLPVFSLPLLLCAQFHLEDKGSSEMCNRFSVADSRRNVVSLPESAGNALDCTPNSPVFSPDGRCLYYFDQGWVRSIFPESGRITDLIQLDSDGSGISDFILSEDGKLLLFVFIGKNQDPHPETEIVVLKLDEGRMVFKWQEKVKVNYSCDGLCTCIRMRDFWFEDERTVGYLTWNIEPYDLDGPRAEKFIRLF